MSDRPMHLLKNAKMPKRLASFQNRNLPRYEESEEGYEEKREKNRREARMTWEQATQYCFRAKQMYDKCLADQEQCVARTERIRRAWTKLPGRAIEPGDSEESGELA